MCPRHEQLSEFEETWPPSGWAGFEDERPMTSLTNPSMSFLTFTLSKIPQGRKGAPKLRNSFIQQAFIERRLYIGTMLHLEYSKSCIPGGLLGQFGYFQ